LSSVQNDGSHTDENIVFNRAAVDDGSVADSDIVTDHGRRVFADMDHDQVLDIGIASDADSSHVASKDGVVPDTAAGFYVDITDDLGSRGNKNVGIDIHGADGSFPKLIVLYHICNILSAADMTFAADCCII
jgi:hypothetical protein